MGGKGNDDLGYDAGEADGETRNQQPLHRRRQRGGDEGAGRAQQQGVDQQPPVDHVAEWQKHQHAQRIAALGHDGGATRLSLGHMKCSGEISQQGMIIVVVRNNERTRRG
jgi:hypothetical protein